MTLRLFLFTLCIALAACSSSKKPQDLMSSIKTHQYESRGWWQSGRVDAVRSYGYRVDRGELAVSSEYCSTRFPDSRNCRAFDEVDLMVSLDRTESPAFLRQMSADQGGHIRTVIATDARSFEREMRDLLADCKIVRRVLISGHGLPGTVAVGDPPRRVNIFTSDLLTNYLNPCVMSPVAQIQFSVCHQACREIMPALTTAFDRIYRNARYTPSGGGAAFDGLQLLMSTAETLESLSNPIFGDANAGTRSANNVAVVFQVGVNGVTQDIPTPQVPQCGQDVRGLVTPARLAGIATPRLRPHPQLDPNERRPIMQGTGLSGASGAH